MLIVLIQLRSCGLNPAGGRREVHKQEILRSGSGQNVFQFEETLPPDLLPSTNEDVRNILDVSYTLVLTSQRGLFGTKGVDGTPTKICIRPHVNLWKDPVKEVIYCCILSVSHLQTLNAAQNSKAKPEKQRLNGRVFESICNSNTHYFE